MSRHWLKKEAGRGSSSQVLILDCLMMSLTVASETGWNAASGWPRNCGSLQVSEEVESISRLWRIVAILLAKKSAKACGRWEWWTVDGRGEDSDLPRRVFVMLCNSNAIIMQNKTKQQQHHHNNDGDDNAVVVVLQVVVLQKRERERG